MDADPEADMDAAEMDEIDEEADLDINADESEDAKED